jgi:hypothetical protein
MGSARRRGVPAALPATPIEDATFVVDYGAQTLQQIGNASQSGPSKPKPSAATT